ncbi:MAG: glycosyl hydrolase, partial [Acidobacteriota bacterium]|nr:glycosyl hydrolase [Acidobacteriota bacterium]
MNVTKLRAGAAVCIVALAAAAATELRAQRTDRAANPNATVNPALYGGLTYRSLGFSRGGRSTAVAGVRTQPLVYYQGSTGGGVWKTSDAGISWSNISDGYFGGGVGAIAVAEADPNIIYVGTGSACPRGNISPGIGFFKSMDAGKSWKFIGLPNAGQVARIQIHPKNPDIAYAAVLGNVFGESQERGVYRTKDGGTTWEKVLYVSTRTGASDISMDPSNPRVLFAGMWNTYRAPWTIHSGSMDGGVYRSTDGGDSWQRMTRGLPVDVMVGKTAVSVSPANPDRVWALVEAADDRGGVFRSDNGGDTWTRTNSQRMLQQRAWYYVHIHADPKNEDTVWASNVGFFKSTDGGRTFTQYGTPHSDNHDLWINPDNPSNMINANDGGANVTMNGANSWTGQMNQPHAEIYRVTVDNRYPYWVYGAQQDNSTVAVPGGPGGFGAEDFYAVGGGESGHIALDPNDPSTIYAGSYGGTISKFDSATRMQESIRAYPDSQTGQKAADMKYRFQWNAPIRVSPHDSNVVYHASQYIHRSVNKGRSWEVISPDLTRNDKTKQDYSGREGVSRDNTGVEVYNTIFALEESPKVRGLIWTGADDGRMHITRDNGKTWTDITPAGMPEGTLNMIDLSAHDPGRALVA